MKAHKIAILVLVSILLAASTVAQAGVFNTPHFVQPGKFSLGFEGQLDFADPASMNASMRYTQGMSDLLNTYGIIGTGGGERGFRLGGGMTFDFFPDLESQPGIGLFSQLLWYRVGEGGLMGLTAGPYIHKTYVSGKHEVEPYLAIPLGFDFSGGRYTTTNMVSFGTLFKKSEHLRFSMEIGLGVKNSTTYFAGGIIYYH